MTWRRVTREEAVGPYAQLWNLEYPDDQRSPNEVAGSYVMLTPDAFEEHWICDDNGLQCVLPAYDYQSKKPIENLSVEVVTQPNNEGLIVEAFDYAEEIWQRSTAKSVSMWSSDRHARRNDDLVRRGFKLVQTVPMTRLDLTTFDPKPFAHRISDVESNGIRLTTIQQLENEGLDWVQAIYDSVWEMVEDLPQPHEPVQPTIEHYRVMIQNRSVYDRNLMFVAMRGDRVVGYSRVSAGEGMPEIARTGLSGVVRDHRRLGIVTALKVVQAQSLKDRGFTTIQTDNDHRNPMYQLNLALGFKDLWNWLQFEKKA